MGMRHCFADCLLDTDSLTLTRSGALVRVEPQVFDLIRLLVENAGRVVTRDEIVETVWNGRIVSDSAISARIAGARKALGDDGKAQRVIRTVARRGLQLVAAVDHTPATSVSAPVRAPQEQRIRYASDAQGRSIAWALTGAGPPLFRLGYNTTHLEAEWHTPCERTAFDRLADHLTLLRYDPVGFGMSDRSDITADFAVMAENALRAADAAGLDRFALFSESGGVHTALHLAAAHPDRVCKLVIAGGYVDGRKRRGADLPETFHALVSEAWDTPDSPFAAALLYPYFPEGPIEAVQAMGRNMQAAASKANELSIRSAIDRISNADLLPRIQCPTLIVHARHDRVHPLSEARKLATGIPQAELMIQDSANHVPIPGNPHYDAYLDAIIRFVLA
ncbi:alpha/beta fold hydrolase [Antarctobacter sp.]|uniref:alpha/beta fold hydrolase n=1 Tax=Antarctobacter sp. TaxID=1872577 RepID=UPI003A8DDFC0